MMYFDIRSVDAVEKKGTRHTPCIEGDVNYDKEEQKSTMESLGCKPPYWNSSSSLRLCSTQEEFKGAAGIYFNKLNKGDKNELRPCRKFENIAFSYDDIEIPDGSDNSSLEMHFAFHTQSYKELKGVRNMDLQTFVGNSRYIYCISGI